MADRNSIAEESIMGKALKNSELERAAFLLLSARRLSASLTTTAESDVRYFVDGATALQALIEKAGSLVDEAIGFKVVGDAAAWRD